MESLSPQSVGAVSSLAETVFSFPQLDQIVAVLTLQAGFNSAVVIVGTLFLGIAAGIVGTFALLRKRSLMADALAHSALPGLAAAFLAAVLLGKEGRSLPVLLLGATLSGVLGVLVIEFLVRYTRLAEDAAIAAVLSTFFGFGIVLLSIIQSSSSGSEGGLHRFIYGQTAAMNTHDAYFTLVVAALSVLAAVFFLKEFRLVCFDQMFAASQGWPVGAIDLLMMALVVVVTVTGLQSVGMLLVVALLIIPACSARFWTEHLGRMTVISGILGGLSGYLGAAASSLFPRAPAGAVIVLVAGAVFLLSFLFAPTRGVVAHYLRLLKLRKTLAGRPPAEAGNL